jgi:hypothetical protein
MVMQIFGPIIGPGVVLFVVWIWLGKPKLSPKKESAAPVLEPINGGNGKIKLDPACSLHPVIVSELGNIKNRLERGDERFDGMIEDIGDIKVNVGMLLERTK